MRIFIGIGLSTKTKENLYELQRNWLRFVSKKNPTLFDNFHLTLQFIGEVSERELNKIADKLEESLADVSSFSIKIGDVGSFIRGSSEVIWAGVTDGKEKLKHLHRRIIEALEQTDVVFRKQRFTPHITLAREVIFDDQVRQLPLINEIESVKTITIYRSHRPNGQLTYTPIYDFILL
ncbi:MAG: RNA 2',3'-cyclic phosphodiesterase [Acholeplasmataceae bacterium]|nr:RNA 2',3'-cyclic phosphodiesterase [Acholeplasmataceae bacterium]